MKHLHEFYRGIYLFLLLSIASLINLSCDLPEAWEKHVVGNQPQATYIYVADIDMDLRPDIISANTDHAGKYISEIAWFRNFHGETWKKTVLNDETRVPIINAEGVVAADIDNDGIKDVIVAASGEPEDMYDTNGGSLHWFKAEKCPYGKWKRFDIITDDIDKYWKVYSFDPDFDGDQDIVVGGSMSAVLFVNPGNAASDDAVWEKHILPFGTGNCINLADMNNDGRTDILSSNFIFGKISWIEIAFLDGQFIFTEHIVFQGLRGAFDIMDIDINEDGKKDLVLTRLMAPGVFWFEAPQVENGEWAIRTIDPGYAGADVYVGDVNGDGQKDVAVAGYAMGMGDQPDNLAWFEYSNQGGEITWAKNYIDETGISAPGDVSLNDMNHDGRLDLVTVSYKTGDVLWYENWLQ